MQYHYIKSFHVSCSRFCCSFINSRKSDLLLIVSNNKSLTFKHFSSGTQNWLHDFVVKLNAEERQTLINALRNTGLNNTAEFTQQLQDFRWRSEFGRPSKIDNINDSNFTHTYYPLPEDWFSRKSETSEVKPSSDQLLRIALYNSLPFIGFGFLDNTIMIICGDYIEMMMGSIITISTMTAAALGNTLSDILGIGSAIYVEKFATKLGIKPPKLTPIQMNMSSTRFAANLGRIFGVTLGCFLGMFPLLFKKEESANEKLL